MCDHLKMCIDKILPGETLKPYRTVMVKDGARAIIAPDKLWPNGSTLSVLFMEGSDEQKMLVKEQAAWWEAVANIHFDFNGDPEADIRITFDENLGAWSYIGTDAASIPKDSATMNLGFMDGGTITHEFGHAIGLHHEHQNPAGGIEWNEDVVIRSLSGPPNNWSEKKIRHNVLNKYSIDQVKGSEFDPDSIMLYFFPDSWVKNGEGTKENEALSAMDKSFIGSSDAYPKGSVSNIIEISVADLRGVAAGIGKASEEDLFTFTVGETGTHTIQTHGKTDLVMKLYGPDSATALIATDDDGGEGVNPKLVERLGPGEYTVQVRHFDQSAGTGEYRIVVSVHT